MSSTSACKVFFLSQTGAGKFPALPYLDSTVKYHRNTEMSLRFMGTDLGQRKGKFGE